MSSPTIGVLGSLLDFNEYESDIVYKFLDLAVKNLDDFKVAARFSNTGINKVAYDWADNLAVPKVGIAPYCCWDYPCRLVEEFYLVGYDWGDEVKKFTEICNAIVIINNRDNLSSFINSFTIAQKQIIDVSGEFEKISRQWA